MSTPGKKSTAKSAGAKKKQPSGSSSRAVVSARNNLITQIPAGEHGSQTMLAPVGYTRREVHPAKNYDVVSFARAMNDDFGPRVKKLFDPEREAALQALQTGIYIGWRCSDFKHDCQRISDNGKCFCGHILSEHANYTARSNAVPCRQGGCKCKAFSWVPQRPEEVGEFWMQRRRDFDPATWRLKCQCKHTHEDHDVSGLHRCKMRGCGCGGFHSSSVCAACDRHWEQHQTFFETADERQQNGLPVGDEYLPFAEIPSLRNMVLTGEDDGDTSYMALNPGPYAAGPRDVPPMKALPPSGQSLNETPFPYSAGPSRSSFRGVYD